MSDNFEQNIRSLLENTFNDIRYTKQQQWNVLYLTLSAIIVIIYLSTIEFHPSSCFVVLLLIGDIVIGIMGIFFS